jgi:hypothetical protein
VRRSALEDERAVGQRVDRCVVKAMPPRSRVDPLALQLRVDRVGSVLIGMLLDPDLDEVVVVLPPAKSARTMPGGEGGRLVQKEELGEAARLQQRVTPPAAEPEPAGDPAFAVVPAPDASGFVVEAAAVGVHESAGGVRDELAERRDPILQSHFRNNLNGECMGMIRQLRNGGRFVSGRASHAERTLGHASSLDGVRAPGLAPPMEAT